MEHRLKKEVIGKTFIFKDVNNLSAVWDEVSGCLYIKEGTEFIWFEATLHSRGTLSYRWYNTINREIETFFKHMGLTYELIGVKETKQIVQAVFLITQRPETK